MKVIAIALFLTSLCAIGCPQSKEPSSCSEQIFEVSGASKNQARSFERDLRNGRLRNRTNDSLNSILSFAAYKLRQKGHRKEADLLQREWTTKWDGYIIDVGRAPGDHSHKPLSIWLQQKTDILTFILGIEVMKATRLWDLVVINDSIPIVFGCEDNVGQEEFGTYFVPFTGVLIYWGSWGACTGLTWGAGFFFCGPIASGCEFLDTQFIAPKLNATIWSWSCKQ